MDKKRVVQTGWVLLALLLLVVGCGSDAPTDIDEDGLVYTERSAPWKVAEWNGSYAGVLVQSEFNSGPLNEVAPLCGDNFRMSVIVSPDSVASMDITAAVGNADPFMSVSRNSDFLVTNQVLSGSSVRVTRWDTGVIGFVVDDAEELHTWFVAFPEEDLDPSPGWPGVYKGRSYADSSYVATVTIRAATPDSLEVQMEILRYSRDPLVSLRLAAPEIGQTSLTAILHIASGDDPDSLVTFVAVLAGNRIGVIARRYHEDTEPGIESAFKYGLRGETVARRQ